MSKIIIAALVVATLSGCAGQSDRPIDWAAFGRGLQGAGAVMQSPGRAQQQRQAMQDMEQLRRDQAAAFDRAEQAEALAILRRQETRHRMQSLGLDTY